MFSFGRNSEIPERQNLWTSLYLSVYGDGLSAALLWQSAAIWIGLLLRRADCLLRVELVT